MSNPYWKKHIVPQRNLATGCIPTGYEIILRSTGLQGINFDTFQEDFDLDAKRKPDEPPKNNFESVAHSIRRKYPTIKFKHVGFEKDEGKQKLEAVDSKLRHNEPVLISLALAPFGHHGWHIMLVVDSSPDKLTLLWGVKPDGEPDTKDISKSDFVYIHENFDGGNDIAFLEKDSEQDD